MWDQEPPTWPRSSLGAVFAVIHSIFHCWVLRLSLLRTKPAACPCLRAVNTGGHDRGFHLCPQPTPTSLSSCAPEGKRSCMNMHERTHMCMHTLAYATPVCACVHPPMYAHTHANTCTCTHVCTHPCTLGALRGTVPLRTSVLSAGQVLGPPYEGTRNQHTQHLVIVCRGAQGCRAMHHPAASPHVWSFFSCQPCCLTMNHPLRKQTNKKNNLGKWP